ncbi:MAG: phosphatidate cytidylyltransferase [Bifidobacterium sp.]|uniref:Phosphatidate cytidylyltransferase n=1 Tax=Bifidobacterium fermentum TaxID=3059035 RepID=A0AB39UFR4_9BIFI
MQNETEDALKAINKRTGRNMPQAVATGALLVVIILACLFIRIDVFVFLIAVFMILGLWELRVDFATAGLHIPFITLSACSLLSILSTFYAPHPLIAMGLSIMLTMILVLIAATVRLSIGTRVPMAVATKLSRSESSARLESSYNHDNAITSKGAFSNVGVSLLTVAYIPLLACFLILPLHDARFSLINACVLVFLPALSDIGGLFFGAMFGRHKLSPRISPKKSYEGLLGSMLFAMAGAFVAFSIAFDADLWRTRWWVPIMLGILVGVVGTFGDLCASMIKRDLGIKDMGHLLKGHGGVLDRVDSILMCAPFIATVLILTLQ